MKPRGEFVEGFAFSRAPQYIYICPSGAMRPDDVDCCPYVPYVSWAQRQSWKGYCHPFLSQPELMLCCAIVSKQVMQTRWNGKECMQVILDSNFAKAPQGPWESGMGQASYSQEKWVPQRIIEGKGSAQERVMNATNVPLWICHRTACTTADGSNE